ncbi:hypothetical protein IFM89_037950 [Coptis chinensis]|uniref:Glycosyl transferase family 28 C-terminal domain-containing protein n=1 Tax=Coptis chinensis TaxID=261450 RepID=A0A835HS05_9MAGN|nr:hypothetical protein IFM89_037950 [Coptis chinensis]
MKMVFVTVGTTSFDALVKAVDTKQVKESYSTKGILIFSFKWVVDPLSSLRSDTPCNQMPPLEVLNQASITRDMSAKLVSIVNSAGEDGCLAVDYFTFSSSIADNLKSASLVISHAGSGSIFETLRLRKSLIVVVNEDLMDNHQSELAEELAARKHLFCARPQTLYNTIANMNLEDLLPYLPADAKPVAKLINRFLGFADD